MSDVIIYTTEDGRTKIDLKLADGTVWLSQLQIADLFQTSKQNVSKHVLAIYEDQELDEQATVNQQLTVQKEGSREVSRALTFYNLVTGKEIERRKPKERRAGMSESAFLDKLHDGAEVAWVPLSECFFKKGTNHHMMSDAHVVEFEGTP